MIFLKLFLLLITIINKSYSYKYLSNNNLKINVSQLEIDFWHDVPLTGYHNSYPPTGINCIAGKENESIIYLISSQSLLNRWNTFESCKNQKRTVSVIKKDLNLSKTVDHLVVGKIFNENKNYKCYRWNDDDIEKFHHLSGSERYEKEIEVCNFRNGIWKAHSTIPNSECFCSCCQKIIKPEGGLGSDYVTSCGIDLDKNILYYIGGNYHNCDDEYNTQPSLVRINLTSFKFIDRTLLYNISGFSEFGNWSDIQKPKHEQYFNYPGNSVIVNGKNIFII